MPPTDHELMHLCGHGMPQAFDELVRRWQQRLARILGRLTGHPRVEDLCQEVFIKVYLARHRYRPTGEFSTWLYRIAVNVARDDARRQRRWARLPPEPVDATSFPSAEVAAVRREEDEAVRIVVWTLPDKLREAIVLKHFGELTFAETADVLGLPVSTVKSRVELALIELRKRLQTSDDSTGDVRE